MKSSSVKSCLIHRWNFVFWKSNLKKYPFYKIYIKEFNYCRGKVKACEKNVYMQVGTYMGKVSEQVSPLLWFWFFNAIQTKLCKQACTKTGKTNNRTVVSRMKQSNLWPTTLNEFSKGSISQYLLLKSTYNHHYNTLWMDFICFGGSQIVQAWNSGLGF